MFAWKEAIQALICVTKLKSKVWKHNKRPGIIVNLKVAFQPRVWNSIGKCNHEILILEVFLEGKLSLNMINHQSYHQYHYWKWDCHHELQHYAFPCICKVSFGWFQHSINLVSSRCFLSPILFLHSIFIAIPWINFNFQKTLKIWVQLY